MKTEEFERIGRLKEEKLKKRYTWGEDKLHTQ